MRGSNPRDQGAQSNSPSSLYTGCVSGFSKIGRTASDGRHRATLFGVQTMGRFTRIGWAIIASSNASSFTDGSSSPNSSAGDFDVRRAARGVRSAAANNAYNCGRVQPVFKYAIMTGSVPEARITASTLREVPQSGLWWMTVVIYSAAVFASNPCSIMSDGATGYSPEKQASQ